MEKILLDEIVKVTGGKLICSRNNYLRTLDKEIVTSVSSNSREIEHGALFVPIVGEKVDAHDYIGMAFEGGAIAAFTSRDIDSSDIPDGKFCIKVDDTLFAVQKLAGWYRRRFSIPVIGITGSVGKTTTKEMIATALSGGLKVLKTEGNQNSQLGVAMMMFRLENKYDIAVIEMGISEHNEMVRLAEIANPEAAVVTNIGVSHIGQLGSKENIRCEKLDITTQFPDEGGLLLLCGNDELLDQIKNVETLNLSKKAKDKINKSVVARFGSNDNCDYKAYNIINDNDGTEFDINMKKSGPLHVKLGVLGIHNVHNAAAALATAEYFGVDCKKAAEKLSEYRPIAMRGQVKFNGGITIIDDTYNSSPDSMKSGLNVLWDKRCNGKRFAVLADVLELGEASEELHRSVGSYIVSKCAEGMVTDELVTVGKEAGYIADEIIKSNSLAANKISVNKFLNREGAMDYLRNTLTQGDLVIVKGSRGMHMDKIVDELMK